MFVKFVEFVEILRGFAEIARYSWKIMGNCGNTEYLKKPRSNPRSKKSSEFAIFKSVLNKKRLNFTHLGINLG